MKEESSRSMAWPKEPPFRPTTSPGHSGRTWPWHRLCWPVRRWRPSFGAGGLRFRRGATVWGALLLHLAAGGRGVSRASRPLRVMALLWTGLFLYMRALVPGLADSFLTWRALVLPALVLTLLCSIRLD